MSQEQVTISGTTYKVVRKRNADDMEATGHKNTARVMRKNRIACDLVLQRPKGKKFYSAVQYANGAYSTVVTL
jgi:hypothetical protein